MGLNLTRRALLRSAGIAGGLSVVGSDAFAILHGSSSSIAPQPAGAVGIWDAADYNSATSSIPNSVTNGPGDANLLPFPRRFFSPGWSGHKPWSVSNSWVDYATAAPDGSVEASTFNGTDAQITKTVVLPAGTYTVWVTARTTDASTPTMRIGTAADHANISLTGSYQRFSHTFVHGGGSVTLWPLVFDVGGSTWALAACDAMLALGTTDPHPNWASVKPQIIQNGDIFVGDYAGDSAVSVSGGVWNAGSVGSLLFNAAVNLNAFTVMWVSALTSPPDTTDTRTILCKAANTGGGADFLKFESGIGNANTDFGVMYNSATQTKVFNAGAEDGAGMGPSLGNGIYFCAQRYDGSKQSTFVNGIKLYDGAASGTYSAPDFQVGCGLYNSLKSGESIRWIALVPSAMTDADIRSLYAQALAHWTPWGQKNAIVVQGTSITNGVEAPHPALGYVSLGVEAATTHKFFGADYGVSSSVLADAVADWPTIAGYLSAAPAATTTTLFLDHGTNDLAAGTSAADFITALASYLTTVRNSGLISKIVVGTILPRYQSTDPNHAAFNTNRATIRTAEISGVAGSGALAGLIDAVCDNGNTATTMGADNAPDNASNYDLFTHPTTAGHALLAPVLTATLNALL